MTRKENIKSLENLINNLETSMKCQPTTNEEFKDFDRKAKILKDTKKELRALLYTEEEIKYQNRTNLISENTTLIQQLETSTKYLPTTEEERKDYDRKTQLLHEYKMEMENAENAIDNDYIINPLQIIVEDLNSEYLIASFVYGSETQKKAIKEMLELRLIEEYGANSELQQNGGYYIMPNLVNENEVGNVKIPKEIAFQVLSELISVPNSKMKIGKKEMMFKVDFSNMREELGMVKPLEANLEVYGKREDGSIDWLISFVYDCKSQVDNLYSDFKNRYLPDLGANSKAFTEYGDYIKPSLVDGSIYGPNQIKNVIVPDFMLHIMAKHLINDNGVVLNVGEQRFTGEYDNNSFISSLDSLMNDGPKLR